MSPESVSIGVFVVQLDAVFVVLSEKTPDEDSVDSADSVDSVDPEIDEISEVDIVTEFSAEADDFSSVVGIVNLDSGEISLEVPHDIKVTADINSSSTKKIILDLFFIC